MSATLEKELRDLWNRRADLDADGLTRLYQLVTARLRSARCPELAALDGDGDEHIHDFFVLKAMDNPVGAIEHANVLVTYFRRFLRDRLQRNATAGGRIDRDDETQWNLPDCLEAPDDGLAAALLDLSEATGLDETALGDAAGRFLDSLDDWARDYLALSFCPDRGLPLVTLAKARRIASYHYKAQKLGITWQKGQTWQGYRETRIGAWLCSLGLEPEPAQAALIATALKILCWQALRQQDAYDQEASP